MPLSPNKIAIGDNLNGSPKVYQMSLIIPGKTSASVNLCAFERAVGGPRIRFKKFQITLTHNGNGKGGALAFRLITDIVTGTTIPAADIPKKDTNYPDAQTVVYTELGSLDRTVYGMERYLSLGGSRATGTGFGGPMEIWDASDILSQFSIREGDALELMQAFAGDVNDQYCINATWLEE